MRKEGTMKMRLSFALLGTAITVLGCSDSKPMGPEASFRSARTESAFTIAIDGPLGVKPDQACTWSARVTSGTPSLPVTYGWVLDQYTPVGDQAYVTMPLTVGGHSLYVSVQDADGNWDWKVIG